MLKVKQFRTRLNVCSWLAEREWQPQRKALHMDPCYVSLELWCPSKFQQILWWVQLLPQILSSSPSPPLKEPPWKSSRLSNPEGESYFQFCDVWKRTENIYKTCLASWLSFVYLLSLQCFVFLDASSVPLSPLNGQQSGVWQMVMQYPLLQVHCSVISFPHRVCCAGPVIFIILYFCSFKAKKKITCRKFYWLI